ncbi:MAG: hypothetical protein HRU18_01255 [Pseudoalteromonas sp.]|uniref:hypothetical protein n=1 Tax=Pseudoalteromonas sp. TaxID=53249 RepID=UPI001D1AEE93|nr:hypothetical protein [Pseudoalteromonas sp.]NRA76807.1 hypothetical protein [Pseudoalteromonas sp.]
MENTDVPVVPPKHNRRYEIALGVANLISNFYDRNVQEVQTVEDIDEIFKDAIRIMHEDNAIVDSGYDPTSAPLKYRQLELNRLYKNINTFNDQWYMKVIENNEEILLTGSRFSDYRFTVSSATLEGAVFLPFNTKLKER